MEIKHDPVCTIVLFVRPCGFWERGRMDGMDVCTSRMFGMGL